MPHRIPRSLKQGISVCQMREMDQRAIEDFGMPVLLLMENAGRAVAETVRKFSNKKSPILILAGSGNNGGDGIVAARYLFNIGWPVEIILSKAQDDFKGDTATHMQLATNFGVPVSNYNHIHEEGVRKKLKMSRIVVDALLGTGTKGEAREPYKTLIRLINEAHKPVIAVDIPSGLDGDKGKINDNAVSARLTITMGAVKNGLLKPSAKEYVGKLIVADIGFPKTLFDN